MSETNSYKKATESPAALTSRGRTLELSQQDEQDLELACCARITALKSLLAAPGVRADPESRAQVDGALQRIQGLLARLVQL